MLTIKKYLPRRVHVWLFRWLLQKTIDFWTGGPEGSASWCNVGNRTIRTIERPKVAITLTIEDRTQPGGYSREELFRMLQTIRWAERIQGWKVPEPAMPVYVKIGDKVYGQMPEEKNI